MCLVVTALVRMLQVLETPQAGINADTVKNDTFSNYDEFVCRGNKIKVEHYSINQTINCCSHYSVVIKRTSCHRHTCTYLRY